MSSVLSIHQRLERVTPELFTRFFYAKKVPEMSCFWCHTANMSIPQMDVTPVAAYNPDSESTSGGASQSSSYVGYICINPTQPTSVLSYQYRIICKKCGFTNHIAVHPILNWLEENAGNNREV
ncbi:hypothetical protein [Candidatus Regiella endosymbiont of Tuberolachnus salignus]|uniref:hypothetical protein n=1 Tax=Candidatus Regiella endosymbiont of Tuberolachnus salignus TaxID=3077956 RepID=UPI0030D520B4